MARLTHSAEHQFEKQLCASILQRLPQTYRQQLDVLTGPQEDSFLLDPDEIRLNQLKADVGALSLLN